MAMQHRLVESIVFLGDSFFFLRLRSEMPVSAVGAFVFSFRHFVASVELLGEMLAMGNCIKHLSGLSDC